VQNAFQECAECLSQCGRESLFNQTAAKLSAFILGTIAASLKQKKKMGSDRGKVGLENGYFSQSIVKKPDWACPREESLRAVRDR
jgi:hypothetical protein